MDEGLALSIVNEAKRGGFYTHAPPSGDELIDLGNSMYDDAVRAFDEGMKNDTVVSIIRMVENAGIVNTGRIEHAPDYKSDATPPPPRPPESRGNPPQAHRMLPLPPEIEGEATPLPRDFTTLTDPQIRHLSSEQQALLSSVTWMLAVEKSDLALASHLRDAAYRKARLRVEGDFKDAESRKVAAMADDDYIEWDDKVSAHSQEVTKLTALKEIYAGGVDRLSREATMRQHEFERSKG